MAMPPLVIGDAVIGTVVDLDPFVIPLAFIFPDGDPERLAPHRDWLEPYHMEGDNLHISFHSTIVQVDGKVILIDTCIGEHKTRSRHAAWRNRENTGYLSRLRARGITPEQVDYVLCTHLHADHVGWNTQLVDGRWIPTFPNARYIIGKAELEQWEEQYRIDGLENDLSFSENVLPIIAAGRVDVVNDDHEIGRGLVLESMRGHTSGQLALRVRRGGQQALIVGDAVQHPVQFAAPDWSSRACWDPAKSRETRQGLLQNLAGTDTWLLPAHFRAPTACRVCDHRGAFRPRFKR